MTALHSKSSAPEFVPASDSSAPLPDWFTASQQEAMQLFTSLPMPGRKDENWRFANVAALSVDGFSRVAAESVPAFAGLEEASARVVTANDAVLSAPCSVHSGVEVLSLSAALEKHGERLRELLVTPDTKLGGAKFAALNHAKLRDAVVVVVAEKAEIAAPVEIIHWLSGEKASSYPRTIILAGARSKVTVVEYHLTAGDDAGLSIGAAQVIAAQGAKVSYVQINRHNAASKAFHFSTLRCERDAQVKHATFNLGSGYVRSEALSLVAGEGSRSDMLSVTLASAGQEVDQRTLQDHLAPHGFSDLLYKNVLFADAKTIFAGLIRVDHGAHFTDAYQKCRNLLLSDDCEANSMPGLEINADQVKCSHGSTSGRLNEEEVFYFQSRGITRQSAEHMISLGFTMEVVARLECDTLETLVIRMVEERFTELETT